MKVLVDHIRNFYKKISSRSDNVSMNKPVKQILQDLVNDGNI